MAFDTTKISVGPGEALYARRNGIARKTVTVKAATVPTTTVFTVTAAEKLKIRKGDVLAAAGTVPTNLVEEASTSPRIKSIVPNGADFDVTVDPAFGVAPAAAAALVILYHDLGATDGDIILKANTEIELMYIDQSIDPVAAILKSRQVQAMLPLAENTLDNFAMALSLSASATPGELALDASTSTVREDHILLITPAPGGLRRFIKLNRMVNQGEASLQASKTAKGIINLNLTALQDSDMTPSLGKLKDVA
jgi:hypothetical protein